MGNDDLSWETTKTFNVGLDFGVLNNRINGNIDFYSARTSDLLLLRRLPNLSGNTDVYANMGKTANHGIDVTINSHNIVTRDFTWTTGLVFSWNHNEIKELYGDGQDDRGNRWFIGENINCVFDYDMVGIWQEDEIERGDHLNWDPVAEAGDVKIADRDHNGKIDDDDRYVKGQTTRSGQAVLPTHSLTRASTSASSSRPPRARWHGTASKAWPVTKWAAVI